MANTTELDAVNQMLTAVGFAEVSSVGSLDESGLAQTILGRVSREIQSGGLHCNTRYKVELTPDGSNFINLTSDMIRVDPSATEGLADDICVRNDKLYNLTDGTDQFDSAIKCDIVYLIDFEQLPEHVRNYIVARAVRQFVLKTVRDMDLWQALQQEEMEAKAAFNTGEFENSDANMLQGFPSNEFLRRAPERTVISW